MRCGRGIFLPGGLALPRRAARTHPDAVHGRDHRRTPWCWCLGAFSRFRAAPRPPRTRQAELRDRTCAATSLPCAGVISALVASPWNSSVSPSKNPKPARTKKSSSGNGPNAPTSRPNSILIATPTKSAGRSNACSTASSSALTNAPMNPTKPPTPPSSSNRSSRPEETSEFSGRRRTRPSGSGSGGQISLFLSELKVLLWVVER